jgi:hypothetical protein
LKIPDVSWRLNMHNIHGYSGNSGHSGYSGNSEKFDIVINGITATNNGYAYVESLSQYNLPHNCNLFSDYPAMPNFCTNEMEWQNVEYENNNVVQTKTPCVVKDVPLQEWVNIIVTIQSKIVSVYMNGKLVNTTTLDKPFVIQSTSHFTITPLNYGFEGNTYNFKYWNSCLNEKQIAKVSKKVFR